MTATTQSADIAATSADPPMGSGRIRVAVAMLGPAFVASVAYVDPGNFATNIQGGARYGCLLLWVVLVANLMAMLVQYLSAKLGIVTGQSLPEQVRERFPRPVTWCMWLQAEVMAMATDIAEFVGAALGLNLLFGIALLPAGLITCVITFAILRLQARGYRAVRAGDHRAARSRRRRLPVRDAPDRPVCTRLAALPGTRHGRRRLAVPRRRDPRCDRDAARDLPALGPDQVPHVLPR
jgi:hypothetical protein